jgi:hypothetical protein
MGEAEIDDPVAALELGVAEAPAVLVGQRDWPADRRALQRRRLGAARRAAGQGRKQRQEAQ